MSPSNIFTIHHKHQHSKARLGTVQLARGTVQTPVFMAIGTVATVKSLTNLELEKLGFEIILGNTYHLWLKPDLKIMETSRWTRPITNPLINDNREKSCYSNPKLEPSLRNCVRIQKQTTKN